MPVWLCSSAPVELCIRPTLPSPEAGLLCSPTPCRSNNQTNRHSAAANRHSAATNRHSAAQPHSAASPVELYISLTLSSLEAGLGDQERGLVSWLSSTTASGPRGEPGWLSPAGKAGSSGGSQEAMHVCLLAAAAAAFESSLRQRQNLLEQVATPSLSCTAARTGQAAQATHSQQLVSSQLSQPVGSPACKSV